jgi:hypothetical protein
MILISQIRVFLPEFLKEVGDIDKSSKITLKEMVELGFVEE